MNRLFANLFLLLALNLSGQFTLQGQGTEKISNGTFDSSTDWTIIGSGYTIGSGVASFDGGATPSYLKQASTDMVSVIEDSKQYLISFVINTASDEDFAWIRIYGSNHTPIYKAFDKYYEGSHKVFITTPASGNDGGIEFYTNNSGDAFDIDSISVIELPALTGGPYFVATEADGGDDINDGSIGSPWASWGRAISAAAPGDTVFFRGGVYYKQPREEWRLSATADLGVDGVRGNPISYMGYPPDIASGDSIIFDCSLMYIPQPDTVGIEAIPPTASPLTVTGIACESDFIVFKGFTIRNIYQKRRYIQTTGFNMSWANNLTVENIVLYNCSGHGFYYDPWWSPDGRDSTIFLNNDAFNCVDSFSINVANYRDLPTAPQAGTWANGFMIIAIGRPDPDTSSYVQFLNNRAWHNADEGVNLSGGGGTFAQGNWSFANGYYLLHGVYDGQTTGNGWKVNGGWSPNLDSSIVSYYFYNNIAAYNYGYGHGENNNGTVSRNREVYNNTMAYNYIGFAAYDPGNTDSLGLYKNKYVNNVSFSSRYDELTNQAEENMYVNEYNSWNAATGVTVSDADFVVTDSATAIAQMKAPRKADGSLPDITFLTLASGSDLIDAGTDVGINYNGTAPDLGYREFETITSSFTIQDTAYITSPVDIIYTGNASDSAAYYWDFGCATVISGSGQGPYIVQWASSVCDTVSLYVVESNIGSDTTAHETIIIDNIPTSDFQLADTAYINSPVGIVYTGTASDTAIYHWDFDGATIIGGSGQGPYTLEWPTPGDRTVSLYVEESGFVSDTTTNDIYIVFLTSDFQLPDTACIASPVDIIYTGNASASATYNWDFNGATIISGSAQGPYTVQWPSPGDKIVSLYVEESGYVSSTTTNICYIEKITSDFQLADTTYINSPVDIVYTGNASTSATYHWDFDGATIISGSGQGPYTLEWPIPGNKTVSLYVEESGFISDTTKNDIYIVFLTSDFQLPDTACIASPVDIIYTGNASASATYNWDFNGATIISGSAQGPYTVQWPSPGDKIVSLYIEESGYVSSTTTNICHIENITSDFQLADTTYINSPVAIVYTGNASTSATYYWDFGSATILSGIGQGPYTLEWASPGDKTVSLYVEESGFISDISTNDIYIIELSSSFNIQDTAYINSPVNIVYTGNASTSATYYWDFGSATILSGIGQGPYTLEWTSPGDKTVSLYVEESGFVSDISTNDIYIIELSSSFNIQDTAYINSPVNIVYTGNASTSATYYWDFNGATIISGSGQGPYTLEWTSPGDKTVSLYVEESGSISDTSTNDIYIIELSSSFNIQDTAYINSPVNIVYTGNASTSATYYWDFNGATIISGSGQGPYTLEWTSPGDKTVSLYVEESGSISDTSTNDIYIIELTSSFNIQDTAYINSPVNIVYTGNASTSATYYWDFNGATIISGSGQGPYTLEWASPGDKTVSLYVEESGFVSDISTNDIYIIELSSSFNIQDTAYINSPVNIVYTGNASTSATYYWDFNGATIISGSGQGPYTLEWTSPGDKTVSLYVEQSGFVSEITTNDIYIIEFTSSFDLQDTAYINSPVNIVYTGNASTSATYYWDFNGATIISGSGQGPYTLEWTSPGDKTVSLYVEQSGFVSEITTNDIYIIEFTSSFDLQDTAYINSPVNIVYTGNASTSATYYWDFNGATIISGSGQGPYTLEWSSVGNKIVSLYVEESGYVSDTTTNDIYILELTSSFNLQDTAHINFPVDIVYTGNASTTSIYHWDFGSANVLSGNGQGPYTVQWPSPGDKSVTLYVEDSGYVSDTTINNTCIEYITSDFQLPDTACRSFIVEIIYTGNASAMATYHWDFDSANILSGFGQGPYTVEWPKTGYKTVSLYVEESGFVSDTSTSIIYIKANPVFTIIPYPNDTVAALDTITLTTDITSGSYLWSSGQTTPSIQVFNAPPGVTGQQDYWLMVTDEYGCSSIDTITVWFDLPVQIKDFPNMIELKVYPNPVRDILNIELEIVEHGQFVFELIDHLGRPVIRELRSFESGAQNMHLDMNRQPHGVYILSVKSNNGWIGVKKILK